MRLYWTAACIAALGLGLAACEPKSDDTKPVDLATTAENPDAADAPDCDLASLSLAFIGKTEDKDRRVYTFGLVNDGAKPCVMKGFAGVDWRQKNGTVLPMEIRHGEASPRQVYLKPKAQAAFDLSSLPNVHPCEKGAHLHVTAPLPGKKTFDAPNGLDICGITTVSPLRRYQP